MKKILTAMLVLCGTSFALADSLADNISSFTLTNETACIVPSTGPTGSPVITPKYLDKIIVGATSGSGSTIILYSSTFTTTNIISSITLNTVFEYDFGQTKVKGICYTTTGNTAGVSIIYKR